MDTEITITETSALLTWMLNLLPIVFFALSVAVVIYVIRMFIRNKRENQRLRLEVGKLADELERARKQSESKSGAVPTQ